MQIKKCKNWKGKVKWMTNKLNFYERNSKNKEEKAMRMKTPLKNYSI